MNKRSALIASSLGVVLLSTVILGSKLSNNVMFGRALGHICTGNHYTEIDENELDDGCHEYWVCCGCHRHYLSTKEIPDYDENKWVDAGEYQRINDKSDTRHISSLFDETISKDGSNFTITDNSITGNPSTNGWAVSKNEYYNFSMDVTLNKSSLHNPWGDHLINNAIIIGGQINDGKLSGYVLQVQEAYTMLFYLDGNNDNKTGNCIALNSGETDYKNRVLHISVIKDMLSVSCDENKLFDDVHLSMKNYCDGYVEYTTSEITYNGGHIGLFNYNDTEDSSRNGATLTVSNFVRGEKSIFANSKFNNDNQWTLSNDNMTITSDNNDGWIMSNDTFTNVSLRVKANAGVSPNVWGNHVVYNSILIGGNVINNQLQGYVVEIQNNHFEIAKLSGDGYKTGDVKGLIGHWGDGGQDFSTSNKNLFIEVSNKELTISSIDEVNRNKETNPSLYPSVSITLDDYVGGHIGYISHQEGTHIVTLQNLKLENKPESESDKIVALNGKWVEENGYIVTKKISNLGLLKNYDLASGTFSSKVCAKDANNCGIIFASDQTAINYYSLFMTSVGGNQMKLVKVSNGTSTELGSCYVSAGYSYNSEITLKVEFNNGDIKCFFNDSMLIYRVDDTALNGTKVGYISKNIGSKFTNEYVSNVRNFSTVDTLIIGHSYMELWSNYKADLYKFNDIDNIGIGGTASSDWVGHRNEVKAYAPNRLIYMIGINDVPRGWSAETIMNNIKGLIDNVMIDLPTTKICLLSINRCVTHEDYKDVIADTNALLKTYTNSHSNLYYGDLDNAFLDVNGNPDPSCFTDGLHPTASSYQVIANAVYTAFGD